MSIQEIENSMKTAWMERAKAHSCYISGGVGNFIEINKKKYIVTCKHVADYFFSKSNSYIILPNNSKIYKNELKYISSTNNLIDIALIEVLNQQKQMKFFTLDDLIIINDFTLVDFSDVNFFIFGFPSQLKYTSDNKEIILWMSYLTGLYKAKPLTKDHIYLDYKRDSHKNVINETKMVTVLPKAPGLSGAFIFSIKCFKEKKEKFWIPSLLKIIAVQSTWDKKNYIKGSNVKYLLDLIDG